MELYLNCASDWSIQDEKGKRYTLEAARKLHEGGKVENCNLGFARLASNGFDLEATRKAMQS